MDTINFHSLLNKHITEECLNHQQFKKIIDDLNNSYFNFELSNDLVKNAINLNEKEYRVLSEKLDEIRHESKPFIDKLITTIYPLQESEEHDTLKSIDLNKILVLIDYLQVQIENNLKDEATLYLAKEPAEIASNTKSFFLSMINDGTRTQLNTIIGIIYFTQEEEISKIITENLRLLQFLTESFHDLINDILDFTKIETGKHQLRNVPFDLKQLISNIKNDNQIEAESKENSIKLMIDDDVPDFLIGDSLHLRQIISSLISNTVKFTKNGHIIIELTLQKRLENIATLCFSVTNTGIGNDSKEQKKAFVPLVQLHSETPRQFERLGLVVTKKLLQLYGGSEVKLETTLGKGSKFYFSIELEIASIIKRLKNSTNIETHHANTLKGVRILLVEDYHVNIKIAIKFLERWKANIDVAENGAIALEKFEVGKYDVILMDIQMPIMDGYTATTEIRKIDPNIPIIALTSSAALNNQDRAFMVGMNEFIIKPFNPKELLRKLSKFIAKS